MKLWMILIPGIIASTAYGTVLDGSSLCPQSFIGKAKEVLEDPGPERAFSKNHVIFANENKQIMVDVLKSGPYQVEVGKEYHVQLRNGKLCSISEV